MGFDATSSSKKILVIKNRAIGDTILMTGPLRLLKQNRPRHQIHVLVRAPAGELLEGLPFIDRVITAKEPTDRIDRFAYWVRLIRRLREMKYEMVLNFHASFRTSLTAQFLRVRTCVANHHELNGRNWFSDVPVPGRSQVKSIIDRDLDVLRAIGINATTEDAMPELVLNPNELKCAVELMAGVPKNYKGIRVFLGVGGSRPTKRWNASHFARIAKMMAERLDAGFVISSLKEEAPWLREFFQEAAKEPSLNGRIAHFEGKSLRETAQLISQCSVYIGNDSGLKHAAAALGLKTFTFFGPEAPLEWHPYDKKYHGYAYLEGLACRIETGKHWCSIQECTKHDHQCMKRLTPESVWPELERILEC